MNASWAAATAASISAYKIGKHIIVSNSCTSIVIRFQNLSADLLDNDDDDGDDVDNDIDDDNHHNDTLLYVQHIKKSVDSVQCLSLYSLSHHYFYQETKCFITEHSR